MTPENPCFGCEVQMPSGQERKAPCCWDIDELNIPTRLESQFASDNATVVRRINDTWMGERSIMSVDGPCPNLDTENGHCTINDIKPLACRDLEPKISPICAKTSSPPGRWNEYIIPVNDIPSE